MSRSRTLRDHRRIRRQAVRAMFASKLPQPLRAAWEHACWALANILDLSTTPAQLVEDAWITRRDHRIYADLIRHLELLARRIILAAAFAMQLILKPIAAMPHKPRPRRQVILWPHSPEKWPARFRMVPAQKPDMEGYIIWRAKREPKHIPAVVSSKSLALRLEAVRRAITAPDACIRRFAIRLARLAQRNLKANTPRYLGIRAWNPRGVYTRGMRYIMTGMEIVQALCEDRIDAWNQAADPG